MSKVCVVGGSERKHADVDYTFAVVRVTISEVDFSSNRGNIISAIRPSMVGSGQVKMQDGRATVRIHNTNTGKQIHENFSVRDNEAEVEGRFAIDGVAGMGAKIELAFINSAQVDTMAKKDSEMMKANGRAEQVRSCPLETSPTLSTGLKSRESTLVTLVSSCRRRIKAESLPMPSKPIQRCGLA